MHVGSRKLNIPQGGCLEAPISESSGSRRNVRGTRSWVAENRYIGPLFLDLPNRSLQFIEISWHPLGRYSIL